MLGYSFLFALSYGSAVIFSFLAICNGPLSLSSLIIQYKSVIEVYANKRQAICRRAYPTDPQNSKGIKLIGKAPEKLDTYKMFPANPY